MDDLIIIPGALTPLEEGGSALQNLAKIASRYSSLNKDKTRAQDFASPGAKKPRLDEKPGVAQALPPTTTLAAKKPSQSPLLGGGGGGIDQNSAATASALLQQFSMLSPGLFGGWSTAGSPSPAAAIPTSKPASSNSSWLSSFNIDPNKIGTEGYNLLKYYEQQLKALQQGATPAPAQPVPKVNGVKEHTSTKKESKGGKEKSKVCKPPPDTKKPPKLMQNPCPFLQTSNIYGSPSSDLAKAKECAARKDEGGTVELNPNRVLDLSSGSNMEFRTISPHRTTPASNSSTGVTNYHPVRPDKDPAEDRNAKAAASEGSLDLSTGRSVTPRTDAKISPFSAEALLSNSRPSSRKNESPKSFPPLNMGIRGILEPERSSPAATAAPSPWNPSIASKPAAQAPRSTASSFGQPATITHFPGLSTETTFSSLSSLPTSSLQPPLNPPPTSNPYLQALMTPQIKPSSAAAAGFPAGLNPMDPMAQYYAAAMYSQQLSAYTAAMGPYAGLGLSGLGGMAGLGGGGIPGLSAASLHGLSPQQAAAFGASGLGGLGAAGMGSQASSLGSMHGLTSMANMSMQVSLANSMASQGMASMASQQQSAAMAAALGGSSSMAAALSGNASMAQALGANSSMAAALGGNASMAAALSSNASMAAALSGGGNSSLSGLRGGYGSASAELQALQAYKDLMTRSQAQAMPPTSSAANPYAALYAGLMGYPGLPHQRKDA